MDSFFILAPLLLSSLLHAADFSGLTECRDRWLQPFSSESIWNMPIGNQAVYAPCNFYPDDKVGSAFGPPTNFHNDQEWPLLSTADDVSSDWMNDAGAFPGNNCSQGNCCYGYGPIATSLPLPAVATDCAPNNNAAALLLPDNRTLVQFQPFYKPDPAPGSSFVAWYHQGAPQDFPWEIDIEGDGALGAHGGSGLSALGGSIRLGELLNTTGPIPHALKLELWSGSYYYGGSPPLQPATEENGGRNQYLWPAIGSDSNSQVPCSQGGLYCGTDPHVAPGTLLAIPPDLLPSLQSKLATFPAQKILQALTDYGGYIVDDTGSLQGGAALCMEAGVNEEFAQAYGGCSLAIENPVTPDQCPDLYWDLVLLYRSLAAVTNNAEDNIGGGGDPRAPLAPPLCPNPDLDDESHMERKWT